MYINSLNVKCTVHCTYSVLSAIYWEYDKTDRIRLYYNFVVKLIENKLILWKYIFAQNVQHWPCKKKTCELRIKNVCFVIMQK